MIRIILLKDKDYSILGSILRSPYFGKLGKLPSGSKMDRRRWTTTKKAHMGEGGCLG